MVSNNNFKVTNHLREGFNMYDPMSYLIEPSTATGIENAYQINPTPEIINEKPLVFVVIGPSGAGKDTIVDYLVERGIVRKLTTATSRPRRINENEPEDSYVWMRQQNPDETEDEYFNDLIAEHELVEYDGHNGRLYGLPKKSLESKSKLPAVIRTENQGLITLREKLDSDYNVISIFIVPDSFDVLVNRIKDRENAGLRITKAIKEVAEAKHIVNYVIVNGDDPIDTPDENKAQAAKSATETLIMSIVGNNSEM